MADDKTESEIEASEDDSQQALVPRDFFMGKDLEVGKKCEVRIEGIFDDEIAISYVKHKKKNKDGKDRDSDDDDDKPKRRRHDRDDSDLMRESLSQMDGMAQPAPAPGGY